MTLTELMVTIGIMTFLLIAVYALTGRAQTVFCDISQSTELRNSIRQALHKMEMEVRNSGYDSSSVAQFSITYGADSSSPDSIRFSVPVNCSTSSSDTFLAANGKPAYWGAALTWGCTLPNCVDADNSCTTVEYKYVTYAMDNSGQLLRTVLGPSNAVIATTVVARHMVNFKIQPSANGRILSLSLTGSHRSNTGRVVTQTAAQDVRLLN